MTFMITTEKPNVGRFGESTTRRNAQLGENQLGEMHNSANVWYPVPLLGILNS